MATHFQDYARNLNRIYLHLFLDDQARRMRICRARASLVDNPLMPRALEPFAAPSGR